MMLTTRQVAELHGVTPRRIRQIAVDRGVVAEGRIGQIPMWSRRQAERDLKPGKPGRPVTK